MLTTLSINNFTLIDQLNIDFSDKFSVITGETGAGKSILLDALGLVIGKRADLSCLKNKSEKCIIEAYFDISNYNLQSFFVNNDLDHENKTVIRREILPSGKSRAFVNDSLVNLPILQELGLYLLDIHSQHQTQELFEENYQINILDIIGDNQEKIQEYKSILKAYKKDRSDLEKITQKYKEFVKERDFNMFLLEELNVAKLKSGEQETLEELFEKLNNVTFIEEVLKKSTFLLNEEEVGVLYQLKEIKNTLQKITPLSKDYYQILERINSILLDLKDVSDELLKYESLLINDPEQLIFVNQKLQNIYSLQKKHQVNTINELLEIKKELDFKILGISNLENQIVILENKIAGNVLKLDSISIEINKNRIIATPILVDKLIKILSLLGMPNSKFNIKVISVNQYFDNGKDTIEFLFSANKGSDFGPLKKIASGGERSRIMLAIKAILSGYTKLPTIIFDEIDTGVSGEIASKIGDIMRKMSQKIQIFSITHLPQVAAKGDQHYKVFKSIIEEETISRIKILDLQERIVEIAQMLSGNQVRDSALKHAKELLNIYN